MNTLQTSYEGFAFREGEEEQALAGRCRLTLSYLEFESAAGNRQWPLTGVVLDENAAGNPVFHDAGTGWWVETTDRRVLADPLLLRHAHLCPRARELRARHEGSRSLQYALIFLIGFVVVFCLG